MKQYEKAEIEIILTQADVIRTSKPGDFYEEDIDWGV